MAVSTSKRKHIAERASHLCEYCGLHENYTNKKHEVDHVIPIKHRGSDDLNNLSWACFDCNRHKGSNIAAFDLETGELSIIFNPRQHQWADHFIFDGGVIHPQTIISRVTILILELNHPIRVEIRRQLFELDLYNMPPSA